MKELEDLLGRENIKYNEPMYKHTSFKVGGPADMFVCVNTIEKLKKQFRLLKVKEYLISLLEMVLIYWLVTMALMEW